MEMTIRCASCDRKERNQVWSTTCFDLSSMIIVVQVYTEHMWLPAGANSTIIVSCRQA